MRLTIILTLLVILLFSCSKKSNNPDKPNEPYISNIEIDSVKTAKTVTVGQNITSRVRLVRPAVCGEMTIQPFEVIENPAKHFAIRAKALYKDWETQICLDVYHTYDTAVVISTKTTGMHILNFYNATRLFKSDTVQVN